MSIEIKLNGELSTQDLRSVISAASDGDTIDVTMVADDIFSSSGANGANKKLFFNLTGGTYSGNHCKTEGGAFSLFTGGTMTLNNVLFADNTTGGGSWNGGGAISTGLYSKSGQIFSNNSIFSGNYSEKAGGAVVVTSSDSYFTDTVFTQNVAKEDGGAILLRQGSVNLTNVTFSGNTSLLTTTGDRGGGAIYSMWGNLYIKADKDKFNSFTNNIANTVGGAISVANIAATTEISSTYFSGNSAGIAGGALHLAKGTITLSGNTFSGNTSAEGGAIYVTAKASSVTVSNCEFVTEKDTIYNDSKVTFSGTNTINASVSGSGTYTVESGASLVFSNSSVIDIATLKFTGENTLNFNGTTVNFTGLDLGTVAITVGDLYKGGDVVIATGVTGEIGSDDTIGRGKETSLYLALDGDKLMLKQHAVTVTRENADGEISGSYGSINAARNAATAGDIIKVTMKDGDVIYGGVESNGLDIALDYEISGGTISGNTGTKGGAFHLHTGASFIADGVLFDGNTGIKSGNWTGGGAIGGAGSYTLDVTGSIFSNNESTGDGGAILSFSGNIEDTVFENNYSNNNGGAIINCRGAVTMSDVVFRGNTSGETGGAIRMQLGNLTISGGDKRNLFELNRANGQGGAIYYNQVSGKPVSATDFVRNYAAKDGGAIYVSYNANSSGTHTYTDCTFTGNTSLLSGGAVYNGKNIALQSVLFSGNEAKNGGAVYNAANAVMTVTDAAFATATDTIYNDGSLTFAGAITLNASLYGSGTYTVAGADFTLGKGIDLNGVDFSKATITVDGSALKDGDEIADNIGGLGAFDITGNDELILSVSADNKLIVSKMAETVLESETVSGTGSNLVTSGSTDTFIANRGGAATLLTTVTGGSIDKNFIGGAFAKAENGNVSVKNTELNIGGEADVKGQVYAGGYFYGTGTESNEAQMIVSKVNIKLDGNAKVNGNLFAGIHARAAANVKVNEISISINGGEHDRVYAGGWAEGKSYSEVGTSVVTIDGGKVNFIYGGGANGQGETYVGATTITVGANAEVGTIFMSGRYGYSSTGAVELNWYGQNDMKRLSGVSSAGIDNAYSTTVNLFSNLTVDGIDFVDKFVLAEGVKLNCTGEFLLGDRINGEASGATIFDFTTDGLDGAWDAISGISDFEHALFSVNGGKAVAWGEEDTLTLGSYTLTRTEESKDKYSISIA